MLTETVKLSVPTSVLAKNVRPSNDIVVGGFVVTLLKFNQYVSKKEETLPTVKFDELVVVVLNVVVDVVV